MLERRFDDLSAGDVAARKPLVEITGKRDQSVESACPEFIADHGV